MRHEVDFLVIGSGIAGLSYALKVAPYGKVCILCKGEAAEGSTRYAQGGIAAVMYDSDSFDKHIQDTLVAGDGICQRDVVEMTIREAPDSIRAWQATASTCIVKGVILSSESCTTRTIRVPRLNAGCSRQCAVIPISNSKNISLPSISSPSTIWGNASPSTPPTLNATESMRWTAKLTR